LKPVAILVSFFDTLMAATPLFDALKMHLKARGMTYAHVARALGVSEATVKRIFATRDCTVARLESLCDLVQIELAELARGLPRDNRLVSRLTGDQERELASDPKLLLIAVCAMYQFKVADMVELYQLDEAACVRLLVRLERIGILELHENNRIRLKLARTFAWIPGGPIMRYMQSQVGDFFEHSFDRPGEALRMFGVRLTKESQLLLLRQVEQLAREYAEQHSIDARLPLAEREHMTMLIAVRSWEPKFFKALRRPGS